MVNINKKQFTIKKEHLTLLQNAYIIWYDSEYGAPGLDSKRPYGSSSVNQSMLEILGLEEIKDGIYKFVLFGEEWLLTGEDKYNINLEGPDEQKLCKKLRQLHEEIETVLQICLITQSFKEGKYEAEKYTTKWKKVV